MSSKRKKSKKPNISSQALERARRELYGNSGIEEESQEASSEKPAEKATRAPERKTTPKRRVALTIEDLKQEYGHVISDLRSMALLAAALFIGMVGVSIFLNQFIFT